MKSSELALMFVCTVAIRGFSQGTVYFSNLYEQQVNAPVFAADGTGALAGPQFMAGLLAGPSSES